ncbi:MAG: hypothetical protein ACRCWS_05800 [Propionibacteriaceae bacterium]
MQQRRGAQAAATARQFAGSLTALGKRAIAKIGPKPEPVPVAMSIEELTAAWENEKTKARVFDDVAIVALGGSATFGLGVATPAQTFICRVSADVSHELNAPLHLTNLAQPQAAAESVLTEQITQLTATGEPDLVVCCLDPDELATTDVEHYLHTLDAIAQALPTGSVMAEMPTASDPVLNELGAQVNLRLRRIARQRGHIVAAIRDIQGLNSIYTTPEEMAIGTNATMDHALWADAMWTAIWASSRFEELR